MLSTAVAAPDAPRAQTLREDLAPWSPQRVRALQKRFAAVTAYFGIKTRDATIEAQIDGIERALGQQKTHIDALRRSHRTTDRELEAALAKQDSLRDALTAAHELGVQNSREAHAALAAAKIGLAETWVAEASPEKLAALERFADGDRAGALEVIVAISNIEEKAERLASQQRKEAEDEASKKRIAANRQQIAGLVDIRVSNGEDSSSSALKAWEAVVQEWPRNPVAWLRIGALRESTGHIGDAEMAYAQAYDTAEYVWQQLNALDALIVIEGRRRNAGLYTERDIELHRRYAAILKVPFSEAEFRGQVHEEESDDAERARLEAAVAQFARDKPPGDLAWVSLLNTHLRLARLDSFRGETAGGRAHIAAAIAAAGPTQGNLKPWQMVEVTARTQLVLGELANDEKRYVEALRRLNDALTAARQLRVKDKDNVNYLDLETDILRTQASVETARGRLAAAQTIREAIIPGLIEMYRIDRRSTTTYSSLRWNLDAYGTLCIELRSWARCHATLNTAEAMLAGGVEPTAADRAWWANVLFEAVRAGLDYQAGDLDTALRRADALQAALGPYRSRKGEKLNSADKNWASVQFMRGLIARDRGQRDLAVQMLDEAFAGLHAFTEPKSVSDERFTAEDYQTCLLTMLEGVRLDPNEMTWRQILTWVDNATAQGFGIVTDEDAAREIRDARRRLNVPEPVRATGPSPHKGSLSMRRPGSVTLRDRAYGKRPS